MCVCGVVWSGGVMCVCVCVYSNNHLNHSEPLNHSATSSTPTTTTRTTAALSLSVSLYIYRYIYNWVYIFLIYIYRSCDLSMYRRYERHFVILMYFCILLIAFLLSYVSRVTFPLRYVSLRYILIIYANPHTHTQSTYNPQHTFTHVT